MQLAKKISKISGFLVLLAPLIVYTGVQFPFTIPRWTWLLATVSIFFVASLALRFDSTSFKFRNIDIAYIILIVIMCLSLFVTTDIRQSIWSGVGRTTGLALYVVCFLWFVGMRMQDYKSDEWKNIFLVTLGVAGAAAAWGLFDMFVLGSAGIGAGQGDRLNLPAGNALILATYLAPYLFIAALLAVERAAFKLSRTQLIFIGLCAAAIAIAVGLTFSRSSYVGIGAGATVGLIGYAIKINRSIGFRRTLKRVLITGALIIVSIGAFYSYATVTQSGGGRLAITVDSLLTLKTRFLNWKIAARSIAEHPIVGVGWENYRSAVDRLFDPTISSYSYYETRIDKPHNSLLEIWVTLGTVGLLAYLFLIYAMVSTAWRLYQRKKISLAGAWAIIGFIVAYQAQNFFAFDTPQTIFAQGLLLAFLASLDDTYREVSTKYFLKLRTPIIIGGAALLAALFMYGGWASLRSMWYINQGLIASQERNFDKLDTATRSAFSGIQGPYYFETWRWFAESLLKSYASGTQKLSDLRPDQRARWEEDVNHIAGLTEKYGTENPDSFEWQIFAGKVSYFIALAKDDKAHLSAAKKYFLRAEEISHLRQEPPVLLSYVYALEDDNRQAIHWYTTAIQLTPSAETASALDWLINRFASEKDTASAIAVLESSVRFNANATDYARLAAAYAEVQRYNEATTAVQKAVELDPSFAEEAQKFISTFPNK